MAVTTDDVATTLGVSAPSATQSAQWGLWITDADLLIHSWADRNGYTYADLDPDVVDYVVREAVAARAKHPDASTQVEVSVDDGRVSRRYESGTGQITILNEWWDLLRPAASSGGGAFSITPYFEPDRRVGW